MKTKIITCISLVVFFLSIPFGTTFFKSNADIPETNMVSSKKNYSYDSGLNFKIKIFDASKNSVTETDIFSCIANQIIRDGAENYSDEAIKALALAIYTDMLYDYNITQDKEIHPEAFICTGCAYCNNISKPDKEIGENIINRIYSLTADIISKGITYNGKIIQGTKIPFSSGKTESASDVYGKDIGYLQGKESYWDISHPNFSKEYSFDVDEFYEKAVITWGVDGNPKESDIKIAETTNNGNVKKINIYGKEISGTSFCLTFNINSSNFSVKTSENKISIITKGMGNSIGLSVYGAEMLARQGYTYEEILKYYYTGIEISDISFTDYVS